MTRFVASVKNPNGAVVRTFHFILHFLEMCAAMCLGMMVLGIPFRWVAGALGYSDPISQIPEWSSLVIAFNMTLPMAAWMLYRGMDWRPTLEMSAAMIIEPVLLIGAVWLGILDRSQLVAMAHVLMMPAMIIPMLFRLDVYTCRMGHHGHTKTEKAACCEDQAH